jgi:DNA-binding transcriptional regulator/RsmH inhibitor MraZ
VDRQGRLLLSGLRRDYGEEVYVLGQGRAIEVWPIDEYNRRMREVAKMYSISDRFYYDS